MQKQNTMVIEYLIFFDGIETTSLINTAITQENLKKHKITLLDEGGQFNIKKQSYKYNNLQIKYTEQQASIVQYEVIIAKFKLQITMINFDQQAPKYNQSLEMGKGTFGTVRLESSSNKYFIVKRQQFKNIQKSTKIEKQWNMNANKDQIDQIIFEYCIYKICSLYKIGPAVDTEIGFDILCYKNNIEFHLQFCDQIYQYPKFRDQFKYEQFERQMKQNLKLMHELKLIHKDIKPENMLYSHQYKRYVLTDFGTSHSVQQNIGERTKTYYAGTPLYMGKQMKKLKYYKQEQVDLYNNDRHGLRFTFKQILSSLKQKYLKLIDQNKKQINVGVYQQRKRYQAIKLPSKNPTQIEDEQVCSKIIYQNNSVKQINKQQFKSLDRDLQYYLSQKNRQSKINIFDQTSSNHSLQYSKYTKNSKLCKEQSTQRTTNLQKNFQQYSLKQKIWQQCNQIIQQNFQAQQNEQFFLAKQTNNQVIQNPKQERDISENKQKQNIQFKDSVKDQNQYQQLKRQFGQIQKQYLETVNKKLEDKLPLFSSESKGYYEYLKLKFIAIKNNLSFKNTEQFWNHLNRNQIFDILNIVLQSSSDLYKKKQIYEIRKDIAVDQQQLLILQKFKQIIDKKQITTDKSNLVKGIQLKLRNYIRIHGHNTQTIKLCEQLQKTNIIKYLELLKKITQKYTEKLQKITQINLKQDNRMIIKKLRKQFVKSKKNKDQKQILRLCIKLLDLVNQNEKQEYITRIETLSIQRNQEQDLIYKIEKMFKKKDHKNLKYSQKEYNKLITVLDGVEDLKIKLKQKNRLFNKLYNNDQYQKSISVGQYILRILEKKNQILQKSISVGQNIVRISEKKNQVLQIKEQTIQLQEEGMIKFKQLKTITEIKIGQIYHKLMNINLNLAKYQKALQYSQNSIKIWKKYSGQQQPNVAASYHQRSMLYLNMGKYQQALNYLQKCIPIIKKYHGQQHPNLAEAFHGLSLIYSGMGKYKQALEYQEKSILIIKECYGQQHPNIAKGFHQQSLIYSKLGMLQKALKCQQNSIMINQKYYGKHNAMDRSYNQLKLLDYLIFFDGIETTSLINTAITQENLKKHKITLLDEGGQFNIKKQSYKYNNLQIKYTEQQASIVQYEVIIAKFKLQITMINFDQQAPKYNQSLEMGKGTFGTVRLESSSNKYFIVKRQQFKNIQKSTKIEKQWNMNANKDQIDQIIFEYCIYKICSLYKIGPAVDTEIGFDILCYKNNIEFHLQFCDQIYQYPKFRDQFKYEQFERQMKQNLKLMHELKLIHKDIKPENMLYSHQYKRYVLTDFGTSHSVQQNIGERTKTYYAGTPLYMGPQMKKLKSQKKGGQVDLYNNDRHGLRFTFKLILLTLKKEYQNKNKKIQIRIHKQIQKKQPEKQINPYFNSIYQVHNQDCTLISRELSSKNIQISKIITTNTQIQIPQRNISDLQKKQFNSYLQYQHQYQKFRQQFGQISIQYLETLNHKIYNKQSSFTSRGYYQYLKVKFVAINYNLSFFQIKQNWNHLTNWQILDILKIVLQSSDLNKKKQVYDIRNSSIATIQEQKIILMKIKQAIDNKQITIAKSNLDIATQLKLKNYIRIYEYETETIILCEQLKKSNQNKYLQLFQKIRYKYIEKVKKINKIDYNYDNRMIIRQLRKKLVKLQNENNKNQKQILTICIELLNYVQQYEKQEYIEKIKLLSIEKTEEQDIIYQIENMFKRDNDKVIKCSEQQYKKIIQGLNDLQKQYQYKSKLFNKLYNYEQYIKCISIGQYLLKMYKDLVQQIVQKEIQLTENQMRQKNLSKKKNQNQIRKLYHRLAHIYLKIGTHDDALKYQQKSIQIKKKYYGQQHPEIAASYHQLSLIKWSMGNYKQALVNSQNSIKIRKKYYGQQHPEIATSYHQLSMIYNNLGKYNQALSYIQKSIFINKRYYGQQHPEIVRYYHQLSLIYNNLAKYKEALVQLQKSILIKKRYYGQQHPEIATSYHQLLLIYNNLENYKQAIAYSQKSILIKHKYYGKQHPQIAKSYDRISQIYRHFRKYTQALRYSQKSIQIKKKYYGQQHLEIAASYHQVSLIKCSMGNYKQALVNSQNSIKIRKKYYGQQHPEIATSYHQLSQIYINMRFYDDALINSLNSIELRKKYYGQSHPEIATSYHQLSQIYTIKEKSRQANNYSYQNELIQKKKMNRSYSPLQTSTQYEQSFITNLYKFPYKHKYYDFLLQKLITENNGMNVTLQDLQNKKKSKQVLEPSLNSIQSIQIMKKCQPQQQGKYKQGFLNCQNSISMLKKYYGQQHPNIAVSYHQKSLIYINIGKYQQALKYSQKSISIKKKYYGQQHFDIAVLYHLISQIYVNMEKYKEALENSQNSIKILKKYYGQQHLSIAISYHQISVIYNNLGYYEQALDYSKISIQLWKRYYHQYHHDIVVLYHQISQIYTNMGNYQQALNYLKNSISIQQKQYNEQHRRIAILYHQLSLIYTHMSNYQSALFSSLKSIQIYRKYSGKQYGRIFISKHQLSFIQNDIGKYQQWHFRMMLSLIYNDMGKYQQWHFRIRIQLFKVVQILQSIDENGDELQQQQNLFN